LPDGLDFVFGEIGGEFALGGIFAEEGAVEDAGGKVGPFGGGVAAIAAVEFAAEFGVGLANEGPGVADRSELGSAFLGGVTVTFAQGLLHGLVGWEGFFVHLVAIAPPPGLIKDGLGAGAVDEFVECGGGLTESFRKNGGELALVLENDKIEFSVLDFVGGGLVLEVELEGLSAGVDEGEFGFGMGRFLDELGDGPFDAPGVAVPDEEDLFWLVGGGGEKREEEEEENSAGGHGFRNEW